LLRTPSKPEARRCALRMAIQVQDIYDVLWAKPPQHASRKTNKCCQRPRGHVLAQQQGLLSRRE
jgi:hypothetical protein